jgi:hypothetical protein
MSKTIKEGEENKFDARRVKLQFIVASSKNPNSGAEPPRSETIISGLVDALSERIRKTRAPSWHTILGFIMGTWSLLVTAHPAQAQSVQIVERGIYTSETVTQLPAPGTGFVNTIRGEKLVANTNIVLGQIGTRFGLRYVVRSSSGSASSMNLVVRFPATGMINPQTGGRLYQTATASAVPDNVPQYWEYNFENQWEIVPGMWLFEFWSGNKLVAKQEFCVIDGAMKGDLSALSKVCTSRPLG